MDRADRADQPILRRGRILNAVAAGLRVPNHHVGAGPAVTRAGGAAILGVDLVALYRDVVEQRAGRPPAVRPDVAACIGRDRIVKHVESIESAAPLFTKRVPPFVGR